MTDEQIKAMIAEYEKGGKFADFVNKSCGKYGTNLIEEYRKVIVYEYYKSVVDGCNKEKT